DHPKLRRCAAANQIASASLRLLSIRRDVTSQLTGPVLLNGNDRTTTRTVASGEARKFDGRVRNRARPPEQMRCEIFRPADFENSPGSHAITKSVLNLRTQELWRKTGHREWSWASHIQ